MTRARAFLLASASALLLAPPLAALGDEPLYSDSFESGDTCFWGAGTPTCPGFHIVTPTIPVPIGQSTRCYYFRTPNAGALGIRKWILWFGEGVEHGVVAQTFDALGDPADVQPPGTLTTADCPSLTSGPDSFWSYIAFDPPQPLEIPADNGGGTPLAMEVGPNQAAFLYLYFDNPNPDPIVSSAILDAAALPDTTVYMRTETFQAIQTIFAIPSNGMAFVHGSNCQPPISVEFWRLSADTHGLGTHTQIKDGSTVLLETNGFQDPTATVFSAPSFYGFSVSGVTWECTWVNNTGSTVIFGTEIDKENCNALGYYFPATFPSRCFGL